MQYYKSCSGLSASPGCGGNTTVNHITPLTNTNTMTNQDNDDTYYGKSLLFEVVLSWLFFAMLILATFII